MEKKSSYDYGDSIRLESLSLEYYCYVVVSRCTNSY